MTTDRLPLPPRARLGEPALDQLFRDARTHYAWEPRDVPDATLRELVNLAKMGPTSANCSPMRIVFIRSPEAKERLRPILAPANVDKTITAPVTALIGYDALFVDKMPLLFPHADARAWFVGKAAFAAETMRRNGAMQAAYLILAARALGLDVGPMSGFDLDKASAEFFPGGQVKADLLVNLGFGSGEKMFPRSPRLPAEVIATTV